jgi:phage terminase large subunit-like protein
VRRELRVRNNPGGRLLVDQLMDFPNADHDDGPDALEMAIRLPMEAKGLEVG